MRYELRNDRLAVGIDSMGAELRSVRRLDDGTEYIWQGDERYWTGHSFNLFPVCGRNIDGKYRYDGKLFDLPIHGFANRMEWACVDHSDTRITFRLCDTGNTYAAYPFRFRLDIIYTLDGDALTEAMHLCSLDDKTMYFNLGGHPGFNLPLEKGLSFDDYRLLWDAPAPIRQIGMSHDCFYLGSSAPFALLKNDKELPLRHSLFDDDAIFLRDTCGAVTLCAKDGGAHRGVRVEYADFPILGLWHCPRSDAPYLCIEPWDGLAALKSETPGAIEEKPEVRTLAPYGECESAFTMIFR